MGAGSLPAPASGGPRTAHRRKQVRLLVAALLIAGSLAFVIVQGLGSALVYFQTADEAVAHRAQLGNQNFNIEGAVVPGSIHRNGETVDFQIASGGVTVPVHSSGSPPQLFAAGVPVVLQGHFAAGDLFLSSQIMVKHSAQYVAAHPNRVKSPYATDPSPGAPASGVRGPAKPAP